VINALHPEREEGELDAPKPNVFGRVLDRIRLGRGVRIHGVDGLVVRYAQCCQPVPGDPVVGYVTKGRGISIHRADCPNLLTMPSDADRRVEIDWQSIQGELFVVCLGVSGEDRRGLYADLMEAVSQTGTNIRSTELWSKDGAMFGSVLVEVENQTHLAKVIRAMRRTKGVTAVDRREPTAGSAART
jgi:GTP pyrophosphokinase